MNRTALHYAAAYTENQNNILYKLLLKAGAKEDIKDLVRKNFNLKYTTFLKHVVMHR